MSQKYAEYNDEVKRELTETTLPNASQVKAQKAEVIAATGAHSRRLRPQQLRQIADRKREEA